MFNRVIIQNGIFQDFLGFGGHGRTGQIKKASWLSRSISINGQKLNKGSLIDFLNSQLSADKQLKKGWFFGFFGGSSDKKVREIFNRVVKSSVKSSPLSQLKQLPLLDHSSKQFVYRSATQIEKDGGICLTSYQDPNSFYEGIVVSKENSEWVLHICPGGGYGEFSKANYSAMMPIVLKELQEKGINPTAFVIDGRHPGDTLQNFQSWQQEA